MPMNVVITRWGSAGDVLPAIAVGAELRRRGHRVTFLGNPHFTSVAMEAGLEFRPAGRLADHRRLMADAEVFGAKKSGLQVLTEHYLPTLEAFHRAVLAAEPDTVVVGGEIGSALAAEKRGLPLFCMACSPGTGAPGTRLTIRSRYDPVHPERMLPGWATWFARTGGRLAFLYRVNNAAYGTLKLFSRSAPTGASTVPEIYRRLRQRFGLPADSDRRPRALLCMWPEWFASPQPDWPSEAVLAGFPFFPRPRFGPNQQRPEARALVVTTGSIAASQRAFYERAVTACKALGREAILVTPHRDDIPQPLPDKIRYVERAPFHEMFGSVSLVIHHGGIGTASYALAAGIPQIVMPMRGDQFDNGNRLVRLGVARMLSPRTATWRQLARAASRLLESPTVSSRCAHWKSRIDPEEGCRRAADCIERFALGRDARERRIHELERG